MQLAHNTSLFKIICLALLLLLSLTQQVFAQTSHNYTLGVGDRIEIQVYGESDLSMSASIDDQGIINYPFVGEIRVLGMTVGQLEQRITNFLKGDYLVNPNVNISILEYRRFFVRGEVKQPGAYPYLPGLSVEKAISLAGGFTERANKKKIYIIFENSSNNKKRRIGLNGRLKPGDIIIVDESFF